MITPRRTRLVRVPDLHTFRHAIVELAVAGDPDRHSSRLVVVPTVGAARQLRRSLNGRPAPEIVTRDELYGRLHARLGDAPRRLTPYERDVMLQAAAREASADDGPRLRPGLLAEMLRFYDQLRRQSRTVARFDQLLKEVLAKDAEYDRGAARMLAQSHWLVTTLYAYERRLRGAEACDEHVLRERLIAVEASAPVREIVVTVADWIADPDGLYPADFDLLTRIPGLEAVDVVATAGVLASGFHQRIHDWMPGIQEVERPRPDGAGAATLPSLLASSADPDRPANLYRDREEELIAVVRRLREAGLDRGALDRVAVVFKRPLPYLYLAREVFGTAGLPFEAVAAMPLAAEPPAAALDLIFEFVESNFGRQAMVALLVSPHFVFEHGGHRLDREMVAALDRFLSRRRYLGTVDRLRELAASYTEREAGLEAALKAATAAADRLAPLLTASPASMQLRRVLDFLDAHQSPIEGVDLHVARVRRGREAIRQSVSALAEAHAAHGDPPTVIGDISASVRRWLEEHTFVPDSVGSSGVQLLDDQAVRYGEFDDMAIVGLIEGEWPEKPKRNVFYPASLLASLGWPTETDRRAATQARFIELLRGALKRVSLSTVSLDDEALVEPSPLLDDIAEAGLPTSRFAAASGDRIGYRDESPGPEALEWLLLRRSRTPMDAEEFHGTTEPLPERRWSVSALETYLACPFKFFAQHVLRLEEEPDDEETMDPRSQGQFVHEVFEAFFRAWQRDGNEAITADNIESAREGFGQVVEQLLARLSETEAALERTRLLGSPAAAGLGEAVFRMEAERSLPVVGRLLEHPLRGDFTFQTRSGPRRMALNGKADRIDLLGDGSFRVIDYKLGWPPNRARALQLPIYALCAEQGLAGFRGRDWRLGEAAYLAFKGPRRVVALFSSADERSRVMTEAQERLVDTVDAIHAGRFPPAPDDVHRCETCTYASVCRKDYVGDV